MVFDTLLLLGIVFLVYYFVAKSLLEQWLPLISDIFNIFHDKDKSDKEQ